MKNWKNKNKNVFILLSVLTLFISLGYALLSSSLTINGNTKLGNSSWDIHFENVVLNQNNVSLGNDDSEAAITINNNTEVTYNVTLSTPGDFYEFEVDAVNDGTVDAMIDTITSHFQIGDGDILDVTPTNLPPYLNYSATYANGSEITLGDLLNAGDSVTYKVRVEFKRDISNNDLPSTDQNITMNFGVNYVQAKNVNIENHTVTFNKNNENATGEMDTQSVLERTNTSLDSNSYSLQNYRFLGWNTKADGTGISYLDGANIFITDDITLYAQWGRLYTLTFDKNNNEAVGEEYTYEVVSGIPTTLPDEAFNAYTLTRKVIESYNTQANNEGISYYQGQNITINSDTTIYAHWDNPPVTGTIYWALQDNNNDDKNEKLVLSSNPVTGNYQGSFAGDTEFSEDDATPWTNVSYNENEAIIEGYNKNNLSLYVENIEIADEIVPASTAWWFYFVGYCSSTFTADFTNLNTSRVTDMSGMFADMGSNATTWNIGDLSELDTSNAYDMSFMFAGAGEDATTFNLDLSDWDTSKVVDMFSIFSWAGRRATTWNIGNLDDWNTSNVTTMSQMFTYAGYDATTWSLGDLDDWDISKVTDISWMFAHTGYNSTTWNIGDLSGWIPSNVERMQGMFSNAGCSSTTWSVGDISGWNTSEVTDMSNMFEHVGMNATNFNLDLSNWDTSSVMYMDGMFNWTGADATTFSIIIPKNNSNGINNTTSRMYGSTSSTYASPPKGYNNVSRTFTLATP